MTATIEGNTMYLVPDNTEDQAFLESAKVMHLMITNTQTRLDKGIVCTTIELKLPNLWPIKNKEP